MKFVVNFSGGLSSYFAAKRIVASHGVKNTQLVFCDTKIEDYDTYRFLDEASDFLKIKLITLADGRDIWQVFKDERFLGNSRADPCSKILKRELMDRWMRDNFTPTDVVRIIGYNWDEQHRFNSLLEHSKGNWTWEAPLSEKPLLDRDDMLRLCNNDGIKPPRLYAFGLAHNNCGGGCVKAGQKHWKIVLEKLPDVYARWEKKEQEMREFLGKDVAMMVSRIGGVKRPLTLREFRIHMQGGGACDEDDWGACSCFAPVDEE